MGLVEEEERRKRLHVEEERSTKTEHELRVDLLEALRPYLQATEAAFQAVEKQQRAIMARLDALEAADTQRRNWESRTYG